MKQLRSTIRKYQVPIVVACLVVGSCFLSLEIFNKISGDLITLFGFIMAAVLPAMVLNATVLRAGNLSHRKLQEYSDALQIQLRVWLGLFMLALVSCVFVIIGKAIDWTLTLSIPYAPGLPDINVGRIISLFVVAGAGLVVLRAYAVGAGIRSLLKLTTDIALSDARARDKERFDEMKQQVQSLDDRRPASSYVDLPH